MSVAGDFPEHLAQDALARYPANTVPNLPALPAARPLRLATVVDNAGRRRIYQMIGKTCGHTCHQA